MQFPCQETIDLSPDSSIGRTLPRLVKEGVHFKCELPDRMFLDSDPEFHLNLKIVLSYILLCHINNYVLIIARRIVAVFLVWFAIFFGLYHFIPTTQYFWTVSLNTSF